MGSDPSGHAWRATFVAAALVLAVMSPRTAWAQSGGSDATARTHFEAGQDDYAHGHFADAAHEFQAAYQLSGRPALLYNVYLALRDLGDLHGAEAALSRYLNDAHDIAPDRRTLLEGRLRALRSRIEAQDAAQAHPAPHASTHGGMGPVPGGLVIGAGVIALAFSLLEGLMASHARSDYEHVCDSTGTTDRCPANQASRLDDLVQKFKTDRTLAWAFGIGGGVVAAAGTVLLIMGLHHGGDAPPDHHDVSFACGPAGCMVGVRGRF